MNEAINASQNVQETEEQKKTRLMLEEMLFKMLFYAAAVGRDDRGDKPGKFIQPKGLDGDQSGQFCIGEFTKSGFQVVNMVVGYFAQTFRFFIEAKIEAGTSYAQESDAWEGFFDYISKNNDGRKGMTSGNFEIKAQIYCDVDSPSGKSTKSFWAALKEFWTNDILSIKKFVFEREDLFDGNANMIFSTIPYHFINEPGRPFGFCDQTQIGLGNIFVWPDEDKKGTYLKKAEKMLEDKIWYTETAKSYHKGNFGQRFLNQISIAQYGFDENDRLNKESNGKFGLKEIMQYDFVKAHNLNVIAEDENSKKDKIEKINEAMRGTFLSKYYEDRMIACMFDQTLLGKEIDYDTIRFWRVVFENTHQGYAESLILLMNHAADETVRNLFSNNEFRKYVIERQNEIANKIEQLKREIEDLNLAISRNESMAIDPSSTQTPEDKRLNLMLKHENSRLENNISQKKAEIEQLESSLTTFFENLIMTCEMQIEEVKKYYHDEKFESENLFTDFISRQSDPSKKPESFEYLYDLKQNYPNIFCDEEYTWEQKFIVAKALLPMGLDVNNFNARTLERFLGICKTPEEFRVAYLLWENTNFINQFWLMPKITQKDLAAIVEYVGADINNKDKLLERIKEFYNELPAFGEAGYFEKNYSKAKLKESVNELVEKIGKNWSPFAKMHLISNLSGLDRDNLEYIRMLFRCNLGKEKKVLDYVGTVLEMSNGATDRNKCVKELFEDKLLREKILSKVEVCSLGQFKEIHEFSGKLDKNVRNEVAANVSYAQIDKVNELKDKKNLWFALVNKPEYINEYFSLAAAVVKNIKDENNRKSFLDSLKNFTETEKQIVLVDPDSFVNDVCFLYERHDKSEYQEEESEKETTEVSQGKGKSVLQKGDICRILADIRDGKNVSDVELKFIMNKKNFELTVTLVRAVGICIEDLPNDERFDELKKMLRESNVPERAPVDEGLQERITNAVQGACMEGTR